MGAIKGYVLGFGFGSAQPAIIRDLRAERVVLRYPELTEGSLSKGSHGLPPVGKPDATLFVTEVS
jgi:hypothetical protein